MIAEAGTAHLGEAENAALLAKRARNAGADVVKFQAFDNPTKETMFCWIKGDEERSKRWHESRLSCEEWHSIQRYCNDIGINFMLSCFEHSTIAWADEMRLSCMKVASRAAKNFPYNDWSRYFLISNGMWQPAHNELAKLPEKATFMECTAEYPAETRWTGALPGYSSHSRYPFRAIEAIRDGAAFVEVHFQDVELDPGPDEPVSLLPQELVTVCEARDYYYEQRK